MRKKIGFFIIFLSLISFSDFSLAQTTPTTPSSNQQQSNEPVTLTAQKVDPNTVAQMQAPPIASAPPQVKKKKELPFYLQPFDLVISAIVHTVMFWDKGD